MPDISDTPPSDLAPFIRTSIERLLTEWDRFARTLAPGLSLDATALRDHAREILLAVADDMETTQSDRQQTDKSLGLCPENAPALSAAARLHGVGRLAARFSLDELAVEFRALRASVLRSLAISDVRASIVDITRFNEAIDQSLSASLAAYAEQVARTHEVERRSELRRQLLVRTEAVQEADRRRIARELHDSLGQKLTAMSLCIAMLEREGAGGAGQPDLHRLRTLLDAVDRELEQIVFELRPMALEGASLGDAVAQHVASWSQLTHVPVDLFVDRLDDAAIPAPLEVAVFRLIQEAMNNIAKHARASRVSVALRRSGRMLALSVEDDGVGFDLSSLGSDDASQARYGLAGMRERVEALDGTLSLETAPGKGCAVLIRVPLGASQG